MTKHDEYVEINAQMRQEMEDIKENLQLELNDVMLEKWKRQYRRSHI